MNKNKQLSKSMNFQITGRSPFSNLNDAREEKSYILLDESHSSLEKLENIIRDKMDKESYAVKMMFKNFDSTGRGYVTKGALLKILYSICGHINVFEFHRLLQKFGLDRKVTISYKQFVMTFGSSKLQSQLRVHTAGNKPGNPLNPKGQQQNCNNVVELSKGFTQIHNGLVPAGPPRLVTGAFGLQLMRNLAGLDDFDLTACLPAHCFQAATTEEPIILREELRDCFAKLNIQMIESEFERVWQKFDKHGIGSAPTWLITDALNITKKLFIRVKPVAPKRLTTAPAGLSRCHVCESGQIAEQIIPSKLGKTAPPSPTKSLRSSTSVKSTSNLVASCETDEENTKETDANVRNVQSARPSLAQLPSERSSAKSMATPQPVPDPRATGLIFLRTKRPRFKSIIDCLNYIFEEPYQAMLISLRQQDIAGTKRINLDQLIDVFQAFGIETNLSQLSSFIQQFGCLTARNTVNYQELMKKFQSKGDHSLLAKYLLNLIQQRKQRNSKTCSSALEIPTELLTLLHRDHIQIYSHLIKLNASGGVTIGQLNQAIEMIVGYKMSDEQRKEIVSLVGESCESNQASLIGVATFLNRFNRITNICQKKIGESEVKSDDIAETVEKNEEKKAETAATQTSANKTTLKKSPRKRDEKIIKHDLTTKLNAMDLSGVRDIELVGQIMEKCLRQNFHSIDKLYRSLYPDANGRLNQEQFVDIIQNICHGKMSCAEIEVCWKMGYGVFQSDWTYKQIIKCLINSLREFGGETQQNQRNLRKQSNSASCSTLLSAKSRAKLTSANANDFRSDNQQHFNDIIHKIAQQIEESPLGNEIMHRFRKLDRMGSTMIEQEQMKVIAKECGLNLTNTELSFILNQFDFYRSGRFNYVKFMREFNVKPKTIPNGAKHLQALHSIHQALLNKLIKDSQNLLQAFRKIDHRKSGHLRIEQIDRILQQNDIFLSKNDLYHLLTSFDTNLDGQIDYTELIQTLINI